MIIKKFGMFNESIEIKGVDFSFNKFIDYTSLTGSEDENHIKDLCEKAKMLNVKSVCVYPKWVNLCKELLKESDVLVCTVIGFPTGRNSLEEKKSECSKAIRNGADEIDMVCNWRLLDPEVEDSENNKKIHNEIYQLSKICNKNGVILKVIVESGKLTEEEVELVTNICIDGNADFIKTSTGKVSSGADIEDVSQMFYIIQDRNSEMKIKASGGIRTIEDLEKFAPFVDRYGLGFESVDKINNIDTTGNSNDKY